MDIKKRISAFVELGKFLRSLDAPNVKSPLESNFPDLIKMAYQYNGWFTEANVKLAVNAIGSSLKEEKLLFWVKKYKDALLNSSSPKKIGIIMAGNIPMVGFHDLLCVLVSGNSFVAKLSSQDKYLITSLFDALISIEPLFKDRIEFTDERLQNIEAVIATGSNNSSRYFDYYFGKYPHIIRKNRNSVAVLDGTETTGELKKLGKDIFQYYGLGCRNVSKIFVPEGYIFNNFFKSVFEFQYVVNNKKYGNNYDYNKTLYLMNQVPLLENGFLILKEDIGLSSPVATLYYEYYSDNESLMARLNADAANIQCLVSKKKEIANALNFGSSQAPELWDYADGVDTMEFLFKV